jgi:hypothetical protein
MPLPLLTLPLAAVARAPAGVTGCAAQRCGCVISAIRRAIWTMNAVN